MEEDQLVLYHGNYKGPQFIVLASGGIVRMYHKQNVNSTTIFKFMKYINVHDKQQKNRFKKNERRVQAGKNNQSHITTKKKKRNVKNAQRKEKRQSIQMVCQLIEELSCNRKDCTISKAM